MSEQKQATQEQLERWRRLDELDSSAMVGRIVTQEELAEIIRSNQDGTAILEYLVKIRDKQKRLNRELKSLASHEEWLVNHIKETLGEERLKEVEN
ncbi:MAG: hypothetical protein AAF630_08410 [Cyanobacteria bacterium P01_C01_bin.38]